FTDSSRLKSRRPPNRRCRWKCSSAPPGRLPSTFWITPLTRQCIAFPMLNGQANQVTASIPERMDILRRQGAESAIRGRIPDDGCLPGEELAGNHEGREKMLHAAAFA